MQQTSKYQFKLIEGTDDFSPTPLNDNMERVEEEFQSVEQALTGIQEELGTAGHNLRVVDGSYTGTGTYGQSNPMQLTFELHPVVVMIVCTSSLYATPPCTMMRPVPCSIFAAGGTGSLALYVTWGEHTVSWYCPTDSTNHVNTEGDTYHYLALGY